MGNDRVCGFADSSWCAGVKRPKTIVYSKLEVCVVVLRDYKCLLKCV